MNRTAQIDIRRSALLVALILAFLAGWFAGSATHDEPTAPCDPSQFGCQFQDDGMWFITDQGGIAHPIAEDSPLWDCRTMGNLTCG